MKTWRDLYKFLNDFAHVSSILDRPIIATDGNHNNGNATVVVVEGFQSAGDLDINGIIGLPNGFDILEGASGDGPDPFVDVADICLVLPKNTCIAK